MNREYDFAFAGHGWYTFKHGEQPADPDDRSSIRILFCYEMHSGCKYIDSLAKLCDLAYHKPWQDVDIVGWSYVDAT
jgi:hypothetical protein